MGLNIKNELTHRRIRELARLTGESMTAAVDTAVRERLERVHHRSGNSKFERMMAIAKECGPLWKEPFKSTDHGDLLYDEKGLPK